MLLHYVGLEQRTHYLPIETGRWQNLDREKRYCNLCNCSKLGDEYHYIFECTALLDKRQLIPKQFIRNHNTVQFSKLMSST